LGALSIATSEQSAIYFENGMVHEMKSMFDGTKALMTDRTQKFALYVFDSLELIALNTNIKSGSTQT